MWQKNAELFVFFFYFCTVVFGRERERERERERPMESLTHILFSQGWPLGNLMCIPAYAL